MPFAEGWEGLDFLQTCRACAVEPTEHVLRVRIDQQKLEHWKRAGTEPETGPSGERSADFRLVGTYVISTGRRPPSCIENSLGTPRGLHYICEKIGDGQPSGMVFKGRVPVGYHYWEAPPEEADTSFVTTRILRLRGLQEGFNSGPGCDTFNRYVYIHGTNREDLLGQPATHGCTVLSNQEMIELFDSVPKDTLLWVE